MLTKLSCEEVVPVTKRQLISSIIRKHMIIDNVTKKLVGKLHIEGLCIYDPKEHEEEYVYSLIGHKEFDYEFKMERVMCKKLTVEKRSHSSETVYNNFNGYVLSINEILPDKENNSINTNPDIKLYLSDLAIYIDQYSNATYHKDMETYMYLDSIDYEIQTE